MIAILAITVKCRTCKMTTSTMTTQWTGYEHALYTIAGNIQYLFQCKKACQT